MKAGNGPAARLARAEQRAKIAKAHADAKESRLKARVYAAAEKRLAEGPSSYANSYDATRRNRFRPGVGNARGGPADAHRDPISLDSLRRQCQELDRTNLLAQTLVGRDIDLTVGDGFTIRSQSSDAAWNRAADEYFTRWAGGLRKIRDNTGKVVRVERTPGECDVRGLMTFADMQAAVVHAWDVEGDIGWVLTNKGQLQGIEAERIQNPRGPLTIDQKGLISGVELDEAGRPVRYHVATGDGVTMGGGWLGGQTAPVPADSFLFLPNPIRQIVGSTRGEPQLAVSIKRFEHLEGFDESARMAARAQASLAWVIKLMRPDLGAAAWEGSDTTGPNGEARREFDIEPLTAKYLGPQEEMQTLGPTQPGPMYEPFVLMQLAFLCAGVGVPLPSFLLDARLVNLASMRCVQQIGWRRVWRKQGSLGTKFVSPVRNWKIAMGIRLGDLTFREDWMAHDWTPPPAPMMDPKTEIEAGLKAVDGRLKSRGRVMDELFGIDRATEWPEIERELRELETRDMMPMAEVGTTGMPQKRTADEGGPSSAAPGNVDPATQDGGEA